METILRNPFIWVVVGFGFLFTGFFQKNTNRNLLSLATYSGACIVSFFAGPLGLTWLVVLISQHGKGMRGTEERFRRGLVFGSASSAVLGIILFVLNHNVYFLLALFQAICFLVARLYLYKRDQKEKAEVRFYTGELREKILARDNHTCVVIGCNETKNLQIDHIIPWSKGGETTFENGQTLCRSHNASKGNKSGVLWRLRTKRPN